jgi:xylose dehydrogenase (NAD/NADP)
LKKNRTIRWGVLGTANIGRVAVIPAIQASKGNELVSIASRNVEKARDFAAKNGIPNSCGSYQELLDNPEIDAVYIPLPNSLHKEWAVKAARAGKHVLCEKPLALSSNECMEMEQAARDSGVFLMEGFMYRFHPRTMKVKAMIDEGVIGKLSTIEASFTFRLTNPDNVRFSAELGGGALMDVGCYCVNVIRTMAGEEPTAVSAQSVPADSGVDGRLAGLMKFNSGILAHFDCSLLDERRERYLVAGDKGFLEVERAFLPGNTDCRIREVHGREKEVVHTIAGDDEYRLMVDHFSDCIVNNRRPEFDAVEAVANMRAIRALTDSADQNGKLIELESV